MKASKKYKISYNEDCKIILSSMSLLNKEIQKMNPTKIIIVYDKAVKKKALHLSQTLNADHILSFHVNESAKSVESFLKIQKEFFKMKLDKKSIVIAVGGGVIGDLLGFCCHTYMRGVRWISVPTTLMAQIDSGVGGKTALNTKFSKNIIGTVYQPSICFLDSDFLKTLPERDLNSGMGEMIKYSLLNSKIRISKKIVRSKKTKSIFNITQKCLDYKMSLVRRDPKDVLGIRKRLNLGHTLAHALETATGYKKYRHGEAVLWGLLFSLLISKNKKLLKQNIFEQWKGLIQTVPVPGLPLRVSISVLWKLCLRDKKSEANQVRMILVQSPGRVQCSVRISKKEFFYAYRELENISKTHL